MKNILLLFLLISSIALAQNQEREFNGFRQKGNTVYIDVNDGKYIIKYISNQIVETTFIPKGEEFIDESHAVILEPEKVELALHSTEDHTFVNGDGISIKVEYKPFQIKYYYEDQIVSEKRGYYKSDHEPMDLVKDNIVYEQTEKIEFNLTDDEILFGGGARALGMNRRGNRLPLYNRAHYGYGDYSQLMNFTIPVVISSKKYMVHFDNSAVGYLDLDSKKNNTLTYETISGRKTYQIIFGDSWRNLIENYIKLTGTQPLPPRWVLGNFSSRFGYHTQKETEETIAKFKEEKIPVDAVILDLYWFGNDIKGTMGNLEVYKDSFPNMTKMISDFEKLGVKTVLITEPFIVNTSNRWQEAVDKKILATDSIGNPAVYNFYFGDTGIIDIYKEEGKNWFWKIYKNLKSMGVRGFWGDLGEPEVLPFWVTFGDDKKADEIHNIYGHDWAKLIYNGYKTDFPNERPFILMRAGYSGSQRFGMIPWSGDVSRSWNGLQSQPEISLQMGLQGLAYMHSDLGGFAGANLDDNLYIRWLQYGVFQPVFRPHAQEDVASEPVFRSERAKQLAKKAVELRYKLLPYNYNLAFENHQKGTPLMRPIFFEEDDKKLLENSTTYLWGEDFLITPILKDSVKTKEIYFPKTANWFDLYTDKKIKGGQTKSIELQEHYIPTFVRGGVVIPLTKVEQTTANYDGSVLELHYWYDKTVKESERTIYNDDGLTANAFEKGKYEMLEFEVEIDDKEIEIDLEAEFGENWNPQRKQVKLILHNITWNPKKIKAAGKRLRRKPINNQLEIPLFWDTKKETKIRISLK